MSGPAAPWPKGSRFGDRGQVADDHLLPVAVLRRSALEHNVATMAAWCRTRGLHLAPHAKTTMSPEIVALQVEAGAWGLTVATANQARQLATTGARRLLIANEVVDPASLRWLAATARGAGAVEGSGGEAAGGTGGGEEGGPWVACYVDSVAGVRLLAEAAAGAARPVPVLLEVGYPGGRTGCRSTAAALEVAHAAAGSGVLDLVGVAGFEGLIGGSRREPDVLAEVDAFLRRLVEAAAALDGQGLLDPARPAVLSAGGSAFFDRVAAALGAVERPGGVEVVLRSGCYVTHDCGLYEQASPLGAAAAGSGERLRNALEVWAPVLSRPEPGLALAGAGRRDLSFDAGLPVPLGVLDRDGRRREAAGLAVTALNDQHAYVSVPTGDALEPGEVLVLGVSHPCTTLDRWTQLLVLDDADRVVGEAHTWF